jgi:hypothetical protein
MRGEKQDASEQEDDGRTGRRAFRGLLWPIDGTLTGHRGVALGEGLGRGHEGVVDVRGQSGFSRFFFANVVSFENCCAEPKYFLAELTPSDCKRPSLAGLVPICTRYTLVDLTPQSTLL